MVLVPAFVSGTGTSIVSTPSWYSAIVSSPRALASSRIARANVS
jgi:hypothetical protein